MKNPLLRLSVSHEAKERLEREAAADGRSISDVARAYLLYAMGMEDTVEGRRAMTHCAAKTHELDEIDESEWPMPAEPGVD